MVCLDAWEKSARKQENTMRLLWVLIAVLLGSLIGPAAAQQSTEEEIAKYRQMLKEGNPADLWDARGEALFKEKRGPKQASLEQCDLGLGPGVVKGAYAQLPRYFKDTGKVQDVESRLVTCMVTLQGFTVEQATKNHFSKPEQPSDMEALVTYVAGQSAGMKINVSLSDPKEKEAYAVGERLFYHRAGPHDFSCATCHGESGKRIRLQELPNLTLSKEAQGIFGSWPAYRVSQGTVRTMQHRLYDCYWQMRHPQVEYTADAITALEMFMAKNANGGEVTAPTLKR
jgi:sulfur-oxidizing protein SoxA